MCRSKAEAPGASETAPGVTEDGCQVWWHPLGRRSPGRCWLLPSPGLPRFADASHCAVSGSTFPFPRCSIPLPLGVISIPILLGSPFFCFSLHHLSLFERPGLDTLAWRKKPTSSQLPALPLAYCSGFMFDSNSTIYTAESSGPNRMSQEPARNLSFS